MQGLASVLQQLPGAPSASSTSLRSLNYDVFNKYRVVVQLHLGDGSLFDWEILDPAAWLSALVHRSAKLQEVWSEALQRHPVGATSPWRLVLGFDEFAPGNKMQVDNRI